MSIEDGRILNAEIMTGVIERVTGDHPELFTPALLATLQNQNMVEQIIEGSTPGLITIEEETEQAWFNPLFTKNQLEAIRTNLSEEFSVDIPDIQIIEQRFRVTNFPEKPDEEKVVFQVGRIQVKTKQYTIKKEDLHSLEPTFEEVFGFSPSENE